VQISGTHTARSCHTARLVCVSLLFGQHPEPSAPKRNARRSDLAVSVAIDRSTNDRYATSNVGQGAVHQKARGVQRLRAGLKKKLSDFSQL
jgi:hypothetical protein